jgi:hypothetical protein
MTRVYSSVREAYIGFLLGEVEEDDSVPSTSSQVTPNPSVEHLFPALPASAGMMVVKGAQAY